MIRQFFALFLILKLNLLVEKQKRQSIPRKWTVHLIISFSNRATEFDGHNWIASGYTGIHEEPYVTETQVANLGLFRIQRREEWTSVCYDISWGITFKKDATLHRPVNETDENEEKKKRILFFRQKI